ALIPVSEAIRTTGGTDLIASALSMAAQSLPGYGAVALMMLAAMMITPFLNNAATVLVMAPIAASFAQKLGLRPDAFLMAVALGAACDFLTPIGHQCNTLVMGPGGYRFGDYARLGAPLSLLILLLGVPLIMIVWPLSCLSAPSNPPAGAPVSRLPCRRRSRPRARPSAGSSATASARRRRSSKCRSPSLPRSLPPPRRRDPCSNECRSTRPLRA